MERDQILLASHRPGDDPVLRVYGWQPAAVTIGYNQDPASFNQEALTAAGYDLVRRPTGGRAILHADELTYAVIGSSPGPIFGSSLHSTYDRINQGLLAFLAGLGVSADVSGGESRSAARGPACFSSAGQYEIRVGGRKLVGSAQRRTGGVFLQHGSILTGPGHLGLAELLGEPGASLDLSAATTDLSRLLGRPQAAEAQTEHASSLVACLATALGLDPEFQGENAPPTAPFT